MTHAERKLVKRLFNSSQQQRDELIGQLRTQVALEEVLHEVKEDIRHSCDVIDDTITGDTVLEQQIRESIPRRKKRSIVDEY